MKEINFNREYVFIMHHLVESLTKAGKFTTAEKQKLFCWLMDYHTELSQQDHMQAKYPDGMPVDWFSEIVLENQVQVLQQALHRDLTVEKITASITIEFDIDVEMLERKRVSANWLLSYIRASNDAPVDGFRINPAVPWCDITSDFFISNPRIVDRKFVKNEV